MLPSLNNPWFGLVAATCLVPAGLATTQPLADDFALDFVVLHRTDNPRLALRSAGVPRVSYNVPTWQVDSSKAVQAAVTRDLTQAGDGFDESILDGAMESRSHDLFVAGDRLNLSAIASQARADGTVHYRFADNPVVDLQATLHPAEADGFPLLTVTARRLADGWISLGYTGAPSAVDAEAEEGWQPLLWTERRFPALPYLTPAHMCPLPGAFVRIAGVLYGVMADPEEIPFQPLPTFDNGGFGVALRTDTATLRPMIFFPMMGGPGSRGTAGETIEFKLRLVKLPGADVTAGFESVARRLFQFRDQRHNALGPLDAVVHRIIDYGMSDFSYWNEELRGCGYSTDVPGAVKNVSSLDPLNAALITGRTDVFQQRARPIMEYLISREKFLFSLDPKQRIQSPSRELKGPASPVSEFATLAAASHEATPVFSELAARLYRKNRVLNLDDVTRGETWWNALSLWESTGEARWLEKARQGADAYIASRVETPATKFVDPDTQGLFFWPGFVPRWIDLMRLHEATGEARYLAAAHRGARLNALFIWMCPLVPSGDVTVNEGGKAPLYWYLGRRGFPPMDAPEESVPAWRVSELGLTPESSSTATGHRGIFMTHHAPWMMRLAALTGDTFLRDIARWAVVGRYRNFPGYHMNTGRTTVYESADYPLQRHQMMSYNSMHYNHIWPMASMLVDYLVTDAWARSAGAISFPQRYIEGYAYLQSGMYSADPGTIHSLGGMKLWMPRGAIDAGSPELNQFAAYNHDGVAVVLSNQAFSAVDAVVRLNAEHFVTLPANIKAQTWVNDGKTGAIAAAGSVAAGFTVQVPAKGVLVLWLPGAKPQTGWSPGGAVPGLVKTGELTLNPGDARAMLLSLGSAETWGYLYLREDDSQWANVALEVVQGERRTTYRDEAFPFEFSFGVEVGPDPIVVRLSATALDGRRVDGEPVSLAFGTAPDQEPRP